MERQEEKVGMRQRGGKEGERKDNCGRREGGEKERNKSSEDRGIERRKAKDGL